MFSSRRLCGCWSVALCTVAVLAAGCSARPRNATEPRVEFTRIPEARLGGSRAVDIIEGRAIGAEPGHRVVLFAKTDLWWVQPFSTEPFTHLNSKLEWRS